VAKSVCRAMKRKVRSGRNPASLVPSILSPRLSSGDLYSLPPLTNLSVGASVARSFAGVRARTRRLFTDSTFESLLPTSDRRSGFRRWRWRAAFMGQWNSWEIAVAAVGPARTPFVRSGAPAREYER